MAPTFGQLNIPQTHHSSDSWKTSRHEARRWLGRQDAAGRRPEATHPQRRPPPGLPANGLSTSDTTRRTLYAGFRLLRQRAGKDPCPPARPARRGHFHRRLRRDHARPPSTITAALTLSLSNPLGVQADALWTEGQDNGFDFSLPIPCGIPPRQRTPQGYVVWMSIPLPQASALPTPTRKAGAFILNRGIPRNNEDTFWPEYTTRISGRLNQEGTPQRTWSTFLPAVTCNSFLTVSSNLFAISTCAIPNHHHLLAPDRPGAASVSTPSMFCKINWFSTQP